MGYVYKITNTINNKAYVGISIHEPEKDRIQKHLSGQGNRIIARAIKKYGKDAFTYEVLEENVFDEFLPDLEVAYIANYNTVAPHGYNLTYGGDHKVPSEDTRRKMSEAHKNPSAETRRKMSEAHKGKKLSEEHRRKISEAGKGRKHSAETRRKMSKARKGEKNPNFGKSPSAETQRRLSEIRKGKKHSAETRRKISEAHKGKTFSAETRRKISEVQKGKKLSAETRRKMSESAKGKNKGEKNPNFHPQHIPVRNYFFSLPSNMSLGAKRKLLYDRFPNIKKNTIRCWVRKWTS